MYYIRPIRINSLQIIQLNFVNIKAMKFKNIVLHIRDVRFELTAVGSFCLFNVKLQVICCQKLYFFVVILKYFIYYLECVSFVFWEN